MRKRLMSLLFASILSSVIAAGALSSLASPQTETTVLQSHGDGSAPQGTEIVSPLSHGDGS